MLQVIKQLFIALIVTVTIGLISLIGVITLIDPNQFKDYIRKQINLSTGRTLTIHGPIYWHMDPGFSLEINDVTLGNAVNFSNEFLNFKKARIEANLWTLFSGKLFINIQLQDLNIFLNRDIAGRSNWEDLQQWFNSKKQSKSDWLYLLPYNIQFENAFIQWYDVLANQHFQISHLDLNVNKIPVGIAGFPISINSKFHLNDLAHHHTGELSCNAEWFFNDKIKQLEVKNLKLSADLQEFHPIHLTGELHLKNGSPTPIVEGKLQVLDLALQQWLTELNLPFYPIMSAKADLNAAFKYCSPALEITSFSLALQDNGLLEGSFQTRLKNQTLKHIELNALLHGKKLRIGSIPIADVKTSLMAKNGVFILDAVQLNLINSQHQGRVEIDLTNTTPRLTISDQIESAEVNELLSLIGEKDKISGKMHANTSLSTMGNTLEEWIHNLSGKAHISLSNGKMRGIELPPLLKHAQSTISMLTDTVSKKQAVNVAAVLTAELGEWKQQALTYQQLSTPFRHLETNLVIENNKIYTSDFKLTHPEYVVNGQGTMDLIHKNIDYQALALLTQTPITKAPQPVLSFLKESPLPIKIYGSLNDLSVRPDLAHYAENALKLVQRESFEKSTENSLKKPNENPLEKLFGFP